MAMDDKPKDKNDNSSEQGRNYTVGYGKPPASGQFKAGVSGNPKGRPKGTKNKHSARHEIRIEDLLIEEGNRIVTINDGDKKQDITLMQAIIRKMHMKAATGDMRAQKLAIELALKTQNKKEQEWAETVSITDEYIRHWNRIFEQFRQSGRPLPEVIPHPDDIHIDYDNKVVNVQGPFLYDDKRYWEENLERYKMLKESVEETEEEIKKTRNPKFKEWLLEWLEFEQKLLDIIEKGFCQTSYAKRMIAG